MSDSRDGETADTPLFAGLRVLDLSQGLAGPYCAELLAGQGAEVIKVEPPAGDWARGAGEVRGGTSAVFAVCNAGKRGVLIDTRRARGRAAITRMALACDVVIESFRPGVAARLGADPAALLAAAPALVYLSLSGFGDEGPYAQVPATDTVLQAESGLMALNADADGRPRKIDLYFADMATAVYGAQAASAALYRRALTGRGRHVRVSMLEACVAMQGPRLAELADAPAERAPVAATVPSGTFRSADGWIVLATLRDEMFEALCLALDRPAWLAREDWRSAAGRRADAAALNARVAETLALRPTAHWLRRLAEHDVLHGRVNDAAGLRAHPQLAHAGMLDTLLQPGFGALPFARAPGSAPSGAPRPAPGLGEHTREVLAALGFAGDEIAALEAGD